jgi:hypothetical protein
VGTGPDLLDEVFTDAPGGSASNYQVRFTITSEEGSDDATIDVRVTS